MQVESHHLKLYFAGKIPELVGPALELADTVFERACSVLEEVGTALECLQAQVMTQHAHCRVDCNRSYT
jgi:hypothetical protein